MAACSIPANFFPVKWDWDLRDFCLVMDGISEIVPATSKDFRRFSEDFRKRPKMFRRTLTTSEAIWLKDDNLSVFWFRWDMQSHHSMPYWNIFMEIELNFRRLFGFVSQTWEKFSLIREIDIFSLQAWDSRIRAKGRESFCVGKKGKVLVTTTYIPLVSSTEASVAKMASSDKVRRLVIRLIFCSFFSWQINVFCVSAIPPDGSTGWRYVMLVSSIILPIDLSCKLSCSLKVSWNNMFDAFFHGINYRMYGFTCFIRAA